MINCQLRTNILQGKQRQVIAYYQEAVILEEVEQVIDQI